MGRVKLARAGAVCALVGVAGFVLGIVLMGSSGVQVLIPPTGKDGLDWIADVQDGGDLFVAGAAIVVPGCFSWSGSSASTTRCEMRAP
jgi:UPF0716 family protein affecting phage T7 exclusion